MTRGASPLALRTAGVTTAMAMPPVHEDMHEGACQ